MAAESLAVVDSVGMAAELAAELAAGAAVELARSFSEMIQKAALL
jgi:hypothetical protein